MDLPAPNEVLEGLEEDADAEIAYRELLKLEPQHTPARVRLGALLAAREDLPAAKTELRAAVRGALPKRTARRGDGMAGGPAGKTQLGRKAPFGKNPDCVARAT